MYTTTLPNGFELDIDLEEGVFSPTYTSELFIRAAYKVIKRPGRVLDLGCGSGLLGIAVAHMCDVEVPVCLSDLSGTAVELAKRNAARHGIEAECRVGSCFEPWEGMRFDYILDDLSGIAERVAEVSPWFGESIPCSSGTDGAKLTIEVLNNAPEHMVEAGVLFFPVLSLSNHQKILQIARERFSSVERVASQTWQLPPEMSQHLPFLRELKHQSVVDFDEKFGMVLCWTEIFVAKP